MTPMVLLTLGRITAIKMFKAVIMTYKVTLRDSDKKALVTVEHLPGQSAHGDFFVSLLGYRKWTGGLHAAKMLVDAYMEVPDSEVMLSLLAGGE